MDDSEHIRLVVSLSIRMTAGLGNLQGFRFMHGGRNLFLPEIEFEKGQGWCGAKAFFLGHSASQYLEDRSGR